MKAAADTTDPTTAIEARKIACARCGAEFSCGLSGPCWCKDEAAKLPMPAEGEDCLCRDCLRKAAGGRE